MTGLDLVLVGAGFYALLALILLAFFMGAPR